MSINIPIVTSNIMQTNAAKHIQSNTFKLFKNNIKYLKKPSLTSFTNHNILKGSSAKKTRSISG